MKRNRTPKVLALSSDPVHDQLHIALDQLAALLGYSGPDKDRMLAAYFRKHASEIAAIGQPTGAIDMRDNIGGARAMSSVVTHVKNALTTEARSLAGEDVDRAIAEGIVRSEHRSAMVDLALTDPKAYRILRGGK